MINFCKSNHVMYIMRGVPGSGKSTIAQSIKQQYPAGKAVICCADDFRYNESGQYVWSRDTLRESHSLCENKADVNCRNGTNVIIIDNTNIKKRDMMKYFQIAHSYAYIVTVVATTERRLHVLANRNQHNVPRYQIAKMINEFENIIAYYYAWKIGRKETSDIKGMVKRILRSCLNVPMFKQFLGNGRYVQINQIYSTYHSRTFSSNENTCHVTTCYTNEGTVPNAQVYAFSHTVMKSLGCVHQLNIIGLCVTSKCLLARVLLTEEQKRYWGRDDSMDGDKNAFCVEPKDDVDLIGAFQRLDVGDVAGKISRFIQNMDGRFRRPNFGVGCTAHITIGVTGNTKPVVAKNNLKQIVLLELNDKPRAEWKLETCLLRCYGDENWVVYFKKPFIVAGMFTGVFCQR